MKKVLSILSIIALSMFVTSTVYAAAYTQADNVVTVDASTVADADDILFQASAQVNFTGVSEATSFAHAAYHTQVIGKKNGRQFGMAADSSSIFWLDISTAGDLLTVDATTSAEFTDFNKM